MGYVSLTYKAGKSRQRKGAVTEIENGILAARMQGSLYESPVIKGTQTSMSWATRKLVFEGCDFLCPFLFYGYGA